MGGHQYPDIPMRPTEASEEGEVVEGIEDDEAA